LVVDDELPIRLLCRVNLEAEGMEVIEAADGRTAVQLAKRELPDLVLLGVMMPRLDGWQAAEELRKDRERREIPIVFLTACARFKDRARGFEVGALDYITKPFTRRAGPAHPRAAETLEHGERDDLRREKMTGLLQEAEGVLRKYTPPANFERTADAAECFDAV